MVTYLMKFLNNFFINQFLRMYFFNGIFTDSFVPIVEKLIKNGADLAARSIYQDTALHQALTKGNICTIFSIKKI